MIFYSKSGKSGKCEQYSGRYKVNGIRPLSGDVKKWCKKVEESGEKWGN
jgi:hypothetical protein